MLKLREFVERHLEGSICRTIGCSSWLAKYFEWPHRIVCTNVVEFTMPYKTRGYK